MCDEIAIIHKGEMLVRDKTGALLDQVDAKTLLIQPDASPPDDIPLPEGVELTRRSGGLLAFGYSRSTTSPDDILAAVRSAGIRIRDVTTEEAHLEEVFLDLTREKPAA